MSKHRHKTRQSGRPRSPLSHRHASSVDVQRELARAERLVDRDQPAEAVDLRPLLAEKLG